MRTCLLCAVCAIPLLAQTGEKRAERYPEVHALTELARSAPPEFAAMGLLRLLDAGVVPEDDWRKDVANEALQLAASVRHPVRKTVAWGLESADTTTGLWYIGYRKGLDRLSLSLRAILHLRRLDRDVAAKTFAQLPRPAPVSAACKDSLVDDVEAWYRAAADLGADPLPIVQTLHAQSEIAPAVDLIFRGQHSPDQMSLLAGALAQSLRNLPASDREFSAAAFDASSKLQHLHKVLIAQKQPANNLIEGWRSWLVTNLETPACEESRKPGPQQTNRQDALRIWNETATTPLPADLLKPSGTGAAAELGPFTKDDTARWQMDAFYKLLFGGRSRGLSAAEKDTPEWRELLQKYIQSIEGRTQPSGQSAVEYFYQQSQLWSTVLMVAPPGSVRERALQQYVSFLLVNAQHIDPAIWFSQLTAMVDTTRSLHGGELERTIQSLRQTGHPVMRLYAELESRYPTLPAPGSN